ncbi:hypothetical protein ACRQ5Q_16670 [Bradyrhizobium sp. PMVTL-01]|uniref:hypothetical protein n=1 Tax=Bradyrhizobium sp. PMVTL-01 TaxID=3434999 RepID=UPI003F70ED5D
MSERTRHYDLSEPWTYRGETQRWVMFSFFSFHNGKLHIGQCQTVKEEDVEAQFPYLERGGWTRATYRYVNGKPELVPHVKALPAGTAQ